MTPARKPPSVTILVVRGVEGPSIYVENYRVAGPKPWGGGTVIHEWRVFADDMREDFKNAMRGVPRTPAPKKAKKKPAKAKKAGRR